MKALKGEIWESMSGTKMLVLEDADNAMKVKVECIEEGGRLGATWHKGFTSNKFNLVGGTTFTKIKESGGESVAQQFVEGGIYQCGNGTGIYVKIIKDLSDDKKHPSSFYQLVGIKCNERGLHTNCTLGMFSSIEGSYYAGNHQSLRNPLQPLKSQEEIEREAKLERISKIEKELEELKKEL